MSHATSLSQLASCPAARLAVALTIITATVALAQSQPQSEPEAASPFWVRSTEDFDSPRAKAQAELIKKQKAAEVEMRKIRRKFLGDVRVTSIRQEGIAKLLAFNDPRHYPALIEVTKGEGDDVRGALVELFATEQTANRQEAASTALAWMAVNDMSLTMRADAAAKLLERVGTGGFKGISSPGVREVVHRALQSGQEAQMEAAAELAQTLHMYEAIAWLIPAQLGQAQTGSGPSGGGDKAWIAIGKQHAFVSDLTPVVGNNAVAFDPTLSVITEGVLLRVHDAAVTTSYRIGINRRLIALSTEATGQSTQGLAWDILAWQQWYATEFYTLAAQRQADLAKPAPEPTR